METDVKFWYLRSHQLFSQMTNEEINELCIISNYKNAKKNEVLYFSETEKRLYALKKGTLKIISIDKEGNENTKDILQQGDIFGELTLNIKNIDDAANEFAKVASPEVSVCSFKVEDFEKVLHKNPTIAIKYTKQVGDKLKAMENRFSNLVFKDVKTRLIEFLKDFAIQNGTENNNSFSVPHFLTQQDIACMIGASRQTVTTLINEMNENRSLIYSRSSFTITNMKNFN